MKKISLKTKDNNLVSAEIVKLDKSDIKSILKLQDIIIEKLENKELYAATNEEEFLDIIQNKGTIIGVKTEEDALIAMGVFLKNNYDDHNYGYDIGISGDDLLSVGQIESTVVLPNFRGNKLQQTICEALENIAKENNTKVITATASPYNEFSVNTFLKLGYEIKADKLKYGGLRRYVFAKNL